MFYIEINPCLLYDLLQKKTKGRALRRTKKEAEAQLKSHGKAEQNSPNAIPTELLKGSSSIRKEMSSDKCSQSMRNPNAISKDKENIMKRSNKIKTHKDGPAQEELFRFKSPHDNKLSESSHKTPLSVWKTLTEAQQRLHQVKGNVRRNENFKESTSFSSRCSFKI